MLHGALERKNNNGLRELFDIRENHPEKAMKFSPNVFDKRI